MKLKRSGGTLWVNPPLADKENDFGEVRKK